MDAKVYDKAVSIKASVVDMERCRSQVLNDFDLLSDRAKFLAALTSDPELGNILASMRNTLTQYFDNRVAPLNKQFEAL